MWLRVMAAAFLLVGCAQAPVDPPPIPAGERPAALFSEGRWSGPIWIPASPDFEELVAAEELADWCGRVVGVRPEVRRESGQPARGGIALGRTLVALKADLLPGAADGDRARRAWWGDTLVIAGNSPAATRMACGRLCESALGIVFVLPAAAGADYAPLSRVAAPADEIWAPAVAWRAVSGMNGPEAIAWARLNGYGTRPRCTHGLHLAFTPELLAARPELAATVAGKPASPPSGSPANPDLGHPDAPAIAAAAARRWLEANPEELAAPMGINDSVVYPETAAAWPGRRVVDGRPDRADFVFGFLNRVAEADWNPGGDRALGALAYLDAQAPPSFPVHPDVFPAVCADRLQYAVPAYAADESARLAAWGRSGVRRLAAWDYWFGRDVPLPRVHLGALAASIRAAHAAGVDSWYAELAPLWIYDAPKAWIGARLLADPAADPDALAERWFGAAYGPAAPHLRALYADIAALWERTLGGRLPGQWLLGWRDGGFRPADLGDLLGAGGESRLAAARAALADAPDDARHRRMRDRLRQFELAWAATRAHFARQEQARLVIRSGAAASPAALPAMLEAERARRAALAAFHAGKWPAQENLAWIRFAEPNPWPLIVGAASVLPADAPAEAVLAREAAARRRPILGATGFSFRGLPDEGQGWRVWVAPPGEALTTPEGFEATAPQGRTHRRFPVEGGDIVRVRVTVQDDDERGNGATLVLRLPASPAPPAAPAPSPAVNSRLHPEIPSPSARGLASSIRLVPGVNVLELPVRAPAGGEAEVEIAFVDRLPRIGLVEIDRLPR